METTRVVFPPKDHWTLKTAYFEDPNPAIQVQTLPGGSKILRARQKKNTNFQTGGTLWASAVTGRPDSHGP